MPRRKAREVSDWRLLSRRAAFASHRLVGWIYWDPRAVAAYEALGVPNGVGYYITSRAGLLGHAGPDVVAAAYYSISPEFVRLSYDLLAPHATIADAVRIRDDAVAAGLREYVGEIADELSSMGAALWAAAESLPVSGRPLFAAHLRHRRPDDQLLDAWLAVNCIREWRGDTHWALQIADGLSGTQAGVLDGAWRSYEADWLPRSRGADDSALSAAYAALEQRGFALNGAVTEAGIAHRQALEDRLDDLASAAWRELGEANTTRFVDLIDTVGDVLIGRVDATAGERWMPAARRHPRSAL